MTPAFARRMASLEGQVRRRWGENAFYRLHMQTGTHWSLARLDDRTTDVAWDRAVQRLLKKPIAPHTIARWLGRALEGEIDRCEAADARARQSSLALRDAGFDPVAALARMLALRNNPGAHVPE